MVNIKEWLIHKLGGFTSYEVDCAIVQLASQIKITHLEPCHLKTEMWFDNYTAIPEEEMIKYAKKELASKLVEELLNKDLIKFNHNTGMEYSNSYNSYKHDKITAELLICKEED